MIGPNSNPWQSTRPMWAGMRAGTRDAGEPEGHNRTFHRTFHPTVPSNILSTPRRCRKRSVSLYVGVTGWAYGAGKIQRARHGGAGCALCRFYAGIAGWAYGAGEAEGQAMAMQEALE